MINKAMIEIPPRFAGMAPVNPEARTSRMPQIWSRAEGLAEDVRYYGEWVRQEAFRRIGHWYPKVKVPQGQGGRRGHRHSMDLDQNCEVPQPSMWM